MTRMALWQKWLYHGGEVVMVLGILWAIYRVLILHVCPLHWFNDITVIASACSSRSCRCIPSAIRPT